MCLVLWFESPGGYRLFCEEFGHSPVSTRVLSGYLDLDIFFPFSFSGAFKGKCHNSIIPHKISISASKSWQPRSHTECLLKRFAAEQNYRMMRSLIMSKSVSVSSYISDCRTSWEGWNLAEPVTMIWDCIWQFTIIQAAVVFPSVSIQSDAKPPFENKSNMLITLHAVLC